MPVTRSQKESVRREAPVSGMEESSSGATTGESGTSYETTIVAATEERTLTEIDDPRTKPTKTVSATSAGRKRREMEARAKLARLQLEEARAAATLAKTELELLQLEEDDDSVISDPPDKEGNVERWVSDAAERMSGGKRDGGTESSGENLQTEAVKPEEPAANPDEGGPRELANAIVQAVRSAIPRAAMAPNYMHELPAYDGSIHEWMAFRTVYKDTAPFFSPVQNMARLRKSIKGKEREQIKGVLYSETTPEAVLEALRRRYGRADALVLVEMDKVKSLPKMTGGPKDVCEFACKVNDVIKTVKGLKKPQYLQSPDMMRTIVGKMTESLQYRWFDFISNKEDPDLTDMGAFLDRQADQCSQFTMLDPATKRPSAAGRKEAVHTAADTTNEQCPQCEGKHRLFECKQFIEATSKECWEIALKRKVCFKCLQGRHRKQVCKKPPCKVCNRWHHSLLHDDQQEASQKTEVTNNAVQVSTARTSKAYLKMAQVEVYGPKGTAKILALLDEGSTITLLDAAIADQLGLQGPTETLTIETVGGKILTKKNSKRIEMQLRGVHQRGRKRTAGARTIDDLRLTSQTIERTRLQEVVHLRELADQLHYEEEPPKLLIGQDNWELIVSLSTKKGKRNEPVASLTRLGWVLHGSDGNASRRVNFVTCAHVAAEEDKLERLIKDHFALEALGVKPRLPSTDIEAKAIDILERASRRLKDGRFETGLLWKNEDERMPDNFKSAENRLRSIEKKLDRDPSLKEYAGNAEDYKDEYPEAVLAVEPNHYMDDYLHSLTTEDEAIQIASEVDAIHRRAGFELRGWASNKTEVVQKLTGEDTANEEIELGSKEERTLGLRWLTEEERWKEYLQSIRLLEHLLIPRCIRHSAHEGELHVFTDASETAYACAVYWRQENCEGQFDVTQLAAKARVTPLKPVSIPRLELQAALLGTRMARSIEEELDIKPARKTYWTDSSTVLSWIKSDPRTFKPFVAHRLAEIEDTAKPREWRWVPTKEIPADDATRAVPPEFDGRHRWFTGPAFLRRGETSWPEPRSFKTKLTGEEKEVCAVTTVKTGDEYATPDPARISSWTRLLRATARVIQFVDLCRGKQQVNISRKQEEADPTWRRRKRMSKQSVTRVSSKENRKFLPLESYQKEMAEKLLLRRSQEECFKEEISSLTKNDPLKRSSKIKFDVLLENDLIKMKGRINAARNLQDDLKRPIVLDSKHTITRLLIAHYHCLLNHGNHATVINEMRQRFWVLGLRAAVRATAHQCQWCRVYKSKPSVPPTGDLPEERLRIGEPPFTCAAVDYFGPMTVTVGRRHEKRWGALFTCLTTRAVHLELTPSLSSSSAIMAIRRMAARRGTPKTIFSDNGTNFVCANRELKEAIEATRGKVIHTFPGRDGRTRVIEVQTVGGILMRPSSKAILLVPAAARNDASSCEVAGTDVGAAHEGEDVGDR